MFLFRWLLNIASLMLVDYIVPGISYSGFWSLFWVSLLLGFLNAVVRPIIIILTLPVNVLTMGLFTFIINAFVFWLVGTIVKGFTITDFNAAFFGALVYYVLILIINYFLEKKPRRIQTKSIK